MKVRSHILRPSAARGIAVMCAAVFVATNVHSRAYRYHPPAYVVGGMRWSDRREVGAPVHWDWAEEGIAPDVVVAGGTAGRRYAPSATYFPDGSPQVFDLQQAHVQNPEDGAVRLYSYPYIDHPLFRAAAAAGVASALARTLRDLPFAPSS
jgi:hypothetical protein